MKDLDIEISRKVAEEAGRQMNDLKKEMETDKNAHIALLEDVLSDVKEQRRFLKSISVSLFILLFIVIAGSFGLSLYNQKLLADASAQNTEKIFEFISTTDFNSSVEMTTDGDSTAENIRIMN